MVKGEDLNKNKTKAVSVKSAAPVKKPARLENVMYGKKWECVSISSYMYIGILYIHV